MKQHVMALMLIVVAAGLPAVAAPATQPVEKVLLLPFAPLQASDRPDAIGRGVQRTLEADLSRNRSIQVVTSDAAAPAGGLDSQAAMKAAQSMGAPFVVYGTYQTSGGGEVRFTGVVADTRTGETLGGLKATGDLRDLFDLQDVVAAQARRALVSPSAAEATSTTAGSASRYDDDGPLRSEYASQMNALTDATDAALSRQNLQLSTDYVSPYDYGYGGYYSPYPAYYGYSPYSYWGFGWPFFIASSFHHHHPFNQGGFTPGGHAGSMPHHGGH